MGEQKRKHTAAVICKAQLLGAVIEHVSSGGRYTDYGGCYTAYKAEFPEDKKIMSFGQRVYRACSETEYQCAVEYLHDMGVPYEALLYGSAGTGGSPEGRLHKRGRKRRRA